MRRVMYVYKKGSDWVVKKVIQGEDPDIEAEYHGPFMTELQAQQFIDKKIAIENGATKQKV